MMILCLTLPDQSLPIRPCDIRCIYLICKICVINQSMQVLHPDPKSSLLLPPVFLWQYIVSFLCRQLAPEACQVGILRQWTPHQKKNRIQESPSRLEYYSSRVRRVGGEERINEQLHRAIVKKRTLLLCNQLTDWWKNFIQDVYILNNKTLGVWPHKAGVFQL